MTQYLVADNYSPLTETGQLQLHFRSKASVPAEGPFAGAETDGGRTVVRRLSAPAAVRLPPTRQSNAAKGLL
jgi:hypothetical protein